MPDPGIATVRRGYELLRQGGAQSLLERFDDFFTEDFEWRSGLIEAVESRVYCGRQGFEQYWRDFTDVFGTAVFGEASLESAGPNRVLVVTTIDLRSTMGDVPITREIAYLFELRGGKVARGESFMSPSEARGRLARA